MQYRYINYRTENNIAFVEFARQEKHNAINYQLFKEIDAVRRIISKNRHLRAVIISGKGQDFSSGIDVKDVFSSPNYALSLLAKWHPFKANLAQRVSVGWRKLPIPVIAAIHGRCWGAGLQICLGADFRFVANDSSISVMEGRWGLIPDMGGTIALKELVKLDIAKRLAMTAEIISAEKAHQLGLVTQVCEDPLRSATDLANELCKQSPDAVAGCKKLYNKSWWSPAFMVLARESWYQIKILLGNNYKIKSFNQTHSEETTKPFKKRMKW